MKGLACSVYSKRDSYYLLMLDKYNDSHERIAVAIRFFGFYINCTVVQKTLFFYGGLKVVCLSVNDVNNRSCILFCSVIRNSEFRINR